MCCIIANAMPPVMRYSSALTVEDCIHIDCRSPPASTSRCKQCWFEHREMFDKCFMRQKNAWNMFVWRWARTQWGNLDCTQQVCAQWKLSRGYKNLIFRFFFWSANKKRKAAWMHLLSARVCIKVWRISCRFVWKNLEFNLKKTHQWAATPLMCLVPSSPRTHTL